MESMLGAVMYQIRTSDQSLQLLRFLIEGPPKVGKTVAMRRLVELLREHGASVSGFVTDEMRERERRVGFVVRDVDGPEAVLAHQDLQTGVRVGRFGVDVPAFERVALPALRRAQETGGAVIIDELGRMARSFQDYRQSSVLSLRIKDTESTRPVTR